MRNAHLGTSATRRSPRELFVIQVLLDKLGRPSTSMEAFTSSLICLINDSLLLQCRIYIYPIPPNTDYHPGVSSYRNSNLLDDNTSQSTTPLPTKPPTPLPTTGLRRPGGLWSVGHTLPRTEGGISALYHIYSVVQCCA